MATPHEILGQAMALHQRGDLAGAACLYQELLALDPDNIIGRANLGKLLEDRGEFDAAIANYQHALRLKPDLGPAHFNLGMALRMRGRIEESISHYRRAVELMPRFAGAQINLGTALLMADRFDEAHEAYQAAYAMAPQDAGIMNNLGNLWKARGMLDESLAAYDRGLELNGRLAVIWSNRAEVLLRMGRADDALASLEQAVARDVASSVIYGNLVYTAQFAPCVSAETLRASLVEWARAHASNVPRISDYPVERDPARRLRIGYLSPDFRQHVVGRNVLPLIREHDRSACEVYCYANVLRPDDLTAEFQRLSTYRDIVGLSDEAVVRQVQDDRIDILVDLSLHMAGNRLGVMARKPAPVQVTFAGYPGSTGMDAIDCRLTDPHLDPRDEDSLYVEKSVRIETFWCYQPPAAAPDVGPLPAASRGTLTFGCLNNFSKVNDRVLALWADVLAALPGSRLIILAELGAHRQRTLSFFEQRGIAGERITFEAKRPHLEFLRLFHEIDISLDTLPYSGHSTSLESLYMGVPVVTLAGDRVSGRAGVSQLTNLGMPQWIARTPQQYVSIAKALAADLPALAATRASLRQRMEKSVLMDAPRFARQIEHAYRDLWRAWCAR